METNNPDDVGGFQRYGAAEKTRLQHAQSPENVVRTVLLISMLQGTNGESACQARADLWLNGFSDFQIRLNMTESWFEEKMEGILKGEANQAKPILHIRKQFGCA